jgi:hypothetical protein
MPEVARGLYCLRNLKVPSRRQNSVRLVSVCGPSVIKKGARMVETAARVTAKWRKRAFAIYRPLGS